MQEFHTILERGSREKHTNLGVIGGRRNVTFFQDKKKPIVFAVGNTGPFFFQKTISGSINLWGPYQFLDPSSFFLFPSSLEDKNKNRGTVE